ncbi:hypothetical protein JTL49_34150, partial [Pseudomonas aeruginosa]|nr:hypothetical protein [Pseudomonas aeruginosa]
PAALYPQRTGQPLAAIIRVIMGDYQHHADMPEAIAPYPIPEDVRQSVRRLVDSAVVLDGA